MVNQHNSFSCLLITGHERLQRDITELMPLVLLG